ncbi:MAG: hypothetical protein LBC41_00595 [Clostridiales bacterium]|jgi:tetratricopeptide (TPR) repeat protein|nr:hypothetical protein [Clostridiales bacterium]MDR2749131.1 hypothetical protein [Clostridiales bacterium]
MSTGKEVRLAALITKGLNAINSGNFKSALQWLEKAEQQIEPGSTDSTDIKYLVSIKYRKATVLERLGRASESEAELQAALKLDDSPPLEDEGMQMGANFNSAKLHLSAGNVSKAIDYADKIDVRAFLEDEMTKNMFKGYILLYMQALPLEKKRAKKAFISALDILKENEEKNCEHLLFVYHSLAIIASNFDKHIDKSLRYCEDAWLMALDVGLELFDPLNLCNLCQHALGNTMSVKRANVLWHNRVVIPAAHMLDKLGNYDAAQMFMASSSCVFMVESKFPGVVTLDRSMKVLHIIEGSRNSSPAEIATAHWLAGCILAKGTSWSQEDPVSQQALKLLKKAARELAAVGEGDNPVYAYAKTLLGEAHLAFGETELSAQEFLEAETIMSTLYGKTNAFKRR